MGKKKFSKNTQLYRWTEQTTRLYRHGIFTIWTGMSLYKEKNDIVSKTLKELQAILQVRAMEYVYAGDKTSDRNQLCLDFGKREAILLSAKTAFYAVIPDSVYLANSISPEKLMEATKGSPFAAENFFHKASQVRSSLITLTGEWNLFLKNNGINPESLESGKTFSEVIESFLQFYKSNNSNQMPIYWMAFQMLGPPCKQLYNYLPSSFFVDSSEKEISKERKNKQQALVANETIVISDDEDEEEKELVVELNERDVEKTTIKAFEILNNCNLSEDVKSLLTQFLGKMIETGDEVRKKKKAENILKLKITILYPPSFQLQLTPHHQYHLSLIQLFQQQL